MGLPQPPRPPTAPSGSNPCAPGGVQQGTMTVDTRERQGGGVSAASVGDTRVSPAIVYPGCGARLHMTWPRRWGVGSAVEVPGCKAPTARPTCPKPSALALTPHSSLAPSARSTVVTRDPAQLEPLQCPPGFSPATRAQLADTVVPFIEAYISTNEASPLLHCGALPCTCGGASPYMLVARTCWAARLWVAHMQLSWLGCRAWQPAVPTLRTHPPPPTPAACPWRRPPPLSSVPAAPCTAPPASMSWEWTPPPPTAAWRSR